MERALEYYFRAYEQAQLWDEIADIYRNTLAEVPAPMPQTLSRYGEILIELEQFKHAFMVLERAMEIDPNDGEIVLGYARGLARAERQDEAEKFLINVLGDKERWLGFKNGVFLVTMLAEIQRRTGRPKLALETFKSYIPEDLVAISTDVGPLPALEYSEALLESGDKDVATGIINRLKSMWPEDPFVNELYDIVNQ